jgi:hypothetical protein
MAQTQLIGFTQANVAEVEQATRALRTTLRPEDYGALGPASTSNKLRTSMASSLLTDMRIATTAALTSGTRTLDAAAIGAASCAVPAVAGSKLLEFIPLWDARPGEHPIVLAQNEGLLIVPTSVPATGTWSFSVKADWAEVASY